MKQLIQRLLFVFAVLLPMAVWSQETVKTLGGIKYTLEEDSWVVTGYDQEQFNELGNGIIEILSSFEDDQQVDHQVKKIRPNAFNGILGVTCLRIYADFETIEDQTFAGLGTEGAPVRLEMDFYRLLNLDFSVANGVCQLAGGYFECMNNEGSPGFSITYKLTKKPERNGEEMIPGEVWLTNVEQYQSNDGYSLSINHFWGYNNYELKLVGIDDNALDGIGSNQAPVALEMNAVIMNQFGGTYADGVISLKGGKFQLKKITNDYGIRVTYVYNGNAQNYGEYIITKVEEIPDLDEGFTDYQLMINTQLDWTQTGEYVPVTTFKSGAITDGAKDLIKSVNIDGIGLQTVEEGAFSGLGARSPLPLQGYNIVALAKILNPIFTDGIASIGGGYFMIGKQDGLINYLLDGEEFIAASYDQEEVERRCSNNELFELDIPESIGEPGVNGDWNYYKVTAIKDGAFNGIKGVNKVIIRGNNLTSIGEDAFKGIGSSEPINLEININSLQRLGGEFTNGVLNIGGGLFVISKTDDNYGIRVTYAYNKSSEDKGEYVVTKVEKSPEDRWGENFTDYQLYIYTRQDEVRDPQTDEWEYVPVTTFKAGAITNDAKGLIKSVYISGTDLKTVEKNAFAGLGSAENLLPFQGENPIALATALGGTFDNGVLSIGGGLFVISKTYDNYGIRVTYAYNKSSEDKGEYVVTKVEKSPEDRWGENFIDYQLRIYTQQDGTWNPQANKWEYVPVTTFKAGAITNDAKGLIKLVYIDGTDLTTVEENAFEGLGTAESPLPLQGNSVVGLAQSLNPTFNDGIAAIGGGSFAIIVGDRFVNYYLNGDEFIAASYNQAQINSFLENDEPVELEIRSYLVQRDIDGNNTEYKVTKIKAGAFMGIQGINSVSIHCDYLTSIGEDAFKGVGTLENPINLDMTVKAFKNFDGDFVDGKGRLAGGVFVIARMMNDERLCVTYAYSEDNNGNGEYWVTKVEEINYYDQTAPYKLTIQDQIDNGEDESGNWTWLPVTTICDNILTMDLANKINIVTIYGNNIKTIQKHAFNGIGSSEPINLDMSIKTFKELGGDFADGKGSLAGGLFVIAKQMDDKKLRVTYAYSEDDDRIGEYIVTKIEEKDYWDQSAPYELFIENQFYNGQDEQGKSIYTPVTTISTGVLTTELASKISMVTINGNNLKTIGENAFNGIGSEHPINLDMTIQTFKKLGGYFAEGKGSLAGGLFVIAKKIYNDHLYVTYNYNEDNEGNGEYWVTTIEDSKDYGDQTVSYGFTIYDSFEEGQDEQGRWIYTPVTTICTDVLSMELASKISMVTINGNNLKTIGENAFNGIGSEHPINLDMTIQSFKKLGGNFADGKGSLAGGLFVIAKQDYYYKLRVTYAYSEDGDENGEYIVTKIEERDDWYQPALYDLIIQNVFDNIPVTTINDDALSLELAKKIEMVTIGNNLQKIKGNAFNGIGATKSVNLDMPVQTFKKLGGRFANSNGQLAGGLFVIAKQIDDYKVAVTYAYSEDGEGNSEYIVTKIEESQKGWWNESDPYRLTISGSWEDGRDEITGLSIYTPVTTISATALNPNLAMKISMVTIYGNNLRTIENDAFAGIGTAEIPVMLEISSTLLASLNPTTEGSAILLQGGYFRTAKTSWVGNSFQNAVYYSDGDGFMLTEPIVAYPGNDEYNLVLQTMLYDYDETTQTQLEYPVTHMAKSAFDGIRNLNINSVMIEGENLQMTLDEDAFEGFGAQTPIDLGISINLFDALGGTITDGVATLAGGRFKLVQMINSYGLRTYYTYQKPVDGDGEYVVSNVEKLYYGADYNDYRLTIESNFYGIPVTAINAGAVSAEVKALALKSVQIRGKNLKSVGENEFDGIGTSESPVNLIIQPEVFNALGGSVEDGFVKLAGGYFMTSAIAKVTTAPVAAEGLEFTGEPLALLTAAGEAENGVMYYYVEQTQQTSDELPMATNAGTYTIGYYAKGTNGYLDSEWYHIQVTIAPKVREDEGSTEVVQISPTQFNVTIDETGGTPTPIDNDLLDADGGIMVYVLNFIRELNETGDPYTVCLPCTPPTEDAIYYSLKDVVNNSELVFEEVANPLANTPYLVVPTTNTNLNKTLNSVRLLKDCGNSQSVGNFTMKGTQTGLTNTEAAAQGAYILQSGNEWKRVVAGSNVSVPPFRAYIVASGAAPARLTSSVGDATAIDTIHTIDQDGTERWYDMNGHRIAQPAKKGVYIINNKKVIKK